MATLVYNSLPEVLEAMREHEIATNTRYCVSAMASNFGREELSRVRRPAIRWKDSANSVTVGQQEFTGIPFVSYGNKVFKCQFGHHRGMQGACKNKTRTSKKIDCPATLQIRAILRFPSYKINSLPSRRESRRITEEIVQHIKLSGHLQHQFRYYMLLPSDDDHQGHPINEEVTPQMIDPRIAARIKELYHQGVHTVKEMRLHIDAYIHEICGGPPDPCNIRFRVSAVTLRNHMYIAKPKPLNPPPKPPKDLPDEVIAGASIETYLNFHGFGEHVGKFHYHQIYDAVQLVHVTKEDLINMKIKKRDRRVILTRIKWLRNKFLHPDNSTVSMQEDGTRLDNKHSIQENARTRNQAMKNIKAGNQAKKNVRAGKQAQKNVEPGNQVQKTFLDSRQQLQEIVQSGQQNHENVYADEDDMCDVGIFDDDTVEEIVGAMNAGHQAVNSGVTSLTSDASFNWGVASLNSGVANVNVVAAELYSAVPITDSGGRNLKTVGKNVNSLAEFKSDGTHLNGVGPKRRATESNQDVSDYDSGLTNAINGITNESVDHGQTFEVTEVPSNNTTSMFTENVIVQDSENLPGYREVTKYTFKHSVTVTLVKVETSMRKSAAKNQQKRQRTR